MHLLRKSVVLAVLFFTSVTYAQCRTEFQIPDIPGFTTLKCDFHTHTVFSDGDVWPTIRVDEAIANGLDAISITDHIEYHKYKDDIPKNLNRPYEAARERAKERGLILIKGAEITRSMPPGHFNALFVKDIDKLDVRKWRDAIKAAIDQGAFVFWNHPGWRQPDELPIWYDEHTEILENGWMHGLEIVNEHSYYPLALTWGLEKGLTLMGNSDVHGLVNLTFENSTGAHRPITLVFAKEKNAASIKEALFNHRTAVYYHQTVFGQPEFLDPLFKQSVTIANSPVLKSNQEYTLYVENHSSIPFTLTLNETVKGVELSETINLGSSVMTPVKFKTTDAFMPGQSVKVPIIVNNMLIAPETPLEAIFELTNSPLVK